MTDLHILSQRGKITKCDEHLLFNDIEGNQTRILPSKINQILLYNSVSITGEAFSVLAKNKILVAIKTYNGIDNIMIQYDEGKNVFLRQNQYRLADNLDENLNLAKQIVMGKLKNQLCFLQRTKRNDKNIMEMEDDILKCLAELKLNLRKVKYCKNLNSLRGIEGMSSRLYFNFFGLHIKPQWAEFKTRSKHPPKTNVNAVLSFLYSLLSQEVTFAAQSKGLDLMVGSLHELCYGRNSLVFDLMEEFRSPIADSICCYLFNDNILNPDNFEDANNGIYLTNPGMKKVVAAFEEKMSQSISYANKTLSYRQIIFYQIENYKKFIMKEVDSYIPFKYK